MKNVKVVDSVSLGINAVTLNNASASIVGSIVNVTTFEEFFLIVRVYKDAALIVHQGQFKIDIQTDTASGLVGAGSNNISVCRLGSFAAWLSSAGADQSGGTPADGVAAVLDAQINLFWSRSGQSNIAQYGGYNLVTNVFYHTVRVIVTGSPIVAGEGFNVTAALGGS